jgi:hypothetical protein
MVRIPKDVADAEDIRAGELVEINVEKARRDLFGALKGMGAFTRSDEMDIHG